MVRNALLCVCVCVCVFSYTFHIHVCVKNAVERTYTLTTDTENPGQTLEFAVVQPYKAVRNKEDLQRFKKGKAYSIIKDFVLALNESCKGKVSFLLCFNCFFQTNPQFSPEHSGDLRAVWVTGV